MVVAWERCDNEEAETKRDRKEQLEIGKRNADPVASLVDHAIRTTVQPAVQRPPATEERLNSLAQTLNAGLELMMARLPAAPTVLTMAAETTAEVGDVSD